MRIFLVVLLLVLGCGKPKLEGTCRVGVYNSDCTFTNTGDGSGAMCVWVELRRNDGTDSILSLATCSGDLDGKTTVTQPVTWVDRSPMDVCFGGFGGGGSWDDCEIIVHNTEPPPIDRAAQQKAAKELRAKLRREEQQRQEAAQTKADETVRKIVEAIERAGLVAGDGYLEVAPHVIYKTYATNAVAGQLQYGGKLVSIEGTIKSIGIDTFKGTPQLRIAVAGPGEEEPVLDAIFANYPARAREAIGMMREGFGVRVACKVERWDSIGLHLVECRFK